MRGVECGVRRGEVKVRVRGEVKSRVRGEEVWGVRSEVLG